MERRWREDGNDGEKADGGSADWHVKASEAPEE